MAAAAADLGCAGAQRPVRLAYQPPASSIFLSEQTSHRQPANSTFLSQQTSTSHQPPAKRTGCKPEEQAETMNLASMYWKVKVDLRCERGMKG
jgi:hypothetical protein